ncbi:glycosyltransferase [Filimonas effusa]|uniref:Glycosyltransferase family 1 protein n=1 Tax=Filimonas effusa TaxID=2508721 RepID=A0A4Q1D7L1_9BACT|nr:glycosyltransferase [Filimonas effusa]RXK83741.1 glycosyltransferase family 1 protein [Filimonas effusa]
MNRIPSDNNRLRIFTWHIHGSYLFYLSQGDYDIYIPVTPSGGEGYYGRGQTFPFGPNVIEVPVPLVKEMDFDCILFQSVRNFSLDQYEILSEAQRRLPRIYVEHNTPDVHPTNTRHPMNDPDVCLVHVTHFNKLMYHNEVPMVRVIDHGITATDHDYTGELERGLVIVNHLHERGRKLGGDLYDIVSKQLPVDLVGMGTQPYGGLGEVLHPQLPAFRARYRFIFNPIRYTSLGLAVLEAMHQGIPVVALATTEYVTVIKDGISGFIHTNIDYLISKMKLLLQNPSLARELGQNGKVTAEERFNIQRFVNDWQECFLQTIHIHKSKHTYETQNSIYQ